jgi:hypothetical protein
MRKLNISQMPKCARLLLIDLTTSSNHYSADADRDSD